MPEDVLSRVRKLVALAARAADHEARNAAVEACRLISQHSLEIVEALAEVASGAPPEAVAGDRVEEWRKKRSERLREKKEGSSSSTGRADKRARGSSDLVGVVARAAGDVATGVIEGVLRKL